MLSFQKIYIISWDRIFSWYSVSKYMKSQNGNPLKNNSFLDIFSVRLQDRSFKIYWQIEVFWIWTRTCLIRWRGCIFFFFFASGPQLSRHSTRVKKWKNSAIKSVVLHDYLKWVLKNFFGKFWFFAIYESFPFENISKTSGLKSLRANSKKVLYIHR